MLQFTSITLMFRLLTLVYQIEEMVQFYCGWSSQILIPLTRRCESMIDVMYNFDIIQEEKKQFDTEVSKMEKKFEEMVREKRNQC